jgi:small subunit ribosomal protein S16
MLRIRLLRKGAKKRPFYHVVVTPLKNARNAGSYTELLGFFNPLATAQETKINIDLDRFQYWVSKGAQPSDRVTSLVKTQKAA